MFFSRPLTILLGVTGTDIDATAAYILGIGAGVGFSILSLCLTTFLQLERMDKMYGLMSAIPSPFGICVIPDTLAVPEEDRIVESISNIDEVIAASKLVIEFCRNKGLSEKTAYFAGL